MPRRDRLVALLTTAAVALAPVAAAHAQSGAGDQQYSDPFGGSSTKTSTTKKSSTSATKKANGTITQVPQLSPSITNPPAVGQIQNVPKASTKSSSGQLPRTGIDLRLLVALGLALVVAGLGLRLRTPDGRF